MIAMNESVYPEMVTSTSTPGSKLMLVCKTVQYESTDSASRRERTYDLLDDLAGGVKVDEALVDLELVTIPGLGTLTTRLNARYTINKKEHI